MLSATPFAISRPVSLNLLPYSNPARMPSVLAEDADGDYQHLLRILLYKLRRMRHTITTNRIVVAAPKVGREISGVERLLERVINEFGYQRRHVNPARRRLEALYGRNTLRLVRGREAGGGVKLVSRWGGRASSRSFRPLFAAGFPALSTEHMNWPIRPA
jgi:hypothetical protein